MNQSIAASAVETPLPTQLQDQLARLEQWREILSFSSPGELAWDNPTAYFASVCNHISGMAETLQRTWAHACKGENLDPAQIGAWARQVIDRLKKYLDARIQEKYYLPAWDEIYGLNYRLMQDLAESERPGKILYFDELGLKCYEIVSAARYGLNPACHRVSVEQPLMECLQSRLIEELECGVRGSISSFGAREAQIVVLLQALVEAAESSMLSEDDMQRMRGFIKIQTEMRPPYIGIDLATEGDCRRAILRQNILLNAALPFFSL